MGKRCVFGTMLLTALVLVSCASVQPTQADATIKPVSISDTRVVHSNDCVFGLPDKKRSAIAVAIGGQLLASGIKIGLNKFGAALRAAGSEKTFTTIRSANIDYDPSRPPACIYIVQGEFLVDGTSAAREFLELTDGSPKCEVPWAAEFSTVARTLRAAKSYCVARKLVESGIFLSGTPEFFFEAKVKMSSNNTAMQLEASALHVTKHLDPSLNSKGATIVVSYAIGDPGSAAPDIGAATVTQMPLGRLKAPTKLFFTGGAGPAAPWLSLSSANQKGAEPRVIWAARSETRDPQEFLLFLADVFDDSKESVTSSLQQSLISSERLKSDLATASARATAANTAEAKWALAEIAMGEYMDLIAISPLPALQLRQQKAVAVRGVQREANILAQTAGFPEYFATLVEIPNK